jgi:hypothetical protein
MSLSLVASEKIYLLDKFLDVLASPFLSILVFYQHLIFMSRYIDEDDLLRFMIKEEVDLVFPLLGGGETGRIDRKDLTDWVVRQFLFQFGLQFFCCLVNLFAHSMLLVPEFFSWSLEYATLKLQKFFTLYTLRKNIRSIL